MRTALMICLLILPFLGSMLLRESVNALFEDTRPVTQAKAIEGISSKAAGKAVPQPVTRKARMHTVKPGDNWWKIANQYKVDMHELIKVNGEIPLRPGMQVEIPAVAE